MYKQEPMVKSRSNEPDVGTPNPERRPRRKPARETDYPEPNPRRDRSTPETPRNPQDLPDQELRS